MNINPKPSSVAVYPQHRVYYFEGRDRYSRADEFIRRVHEAGRSVSVISAAHPCSDTPDYVEVAVSKEVHR